MHIHILNLIIKHRRYFPCFNLFITINLHATKQFNIKFLLVIELPFNSVDINRVK